VYIYIYIYIYVCVCVCVYLLHEVNELCLSEARNACVLYGFGQ